MFLLTQQVCLTSSRNEFFIGQDSCKDMGGNLMFKFAVILVHGLIFILATLIGLGGVFNPSSPDPSRTYEVWFTAIAIFNILVVVSVFVQLKIKKVWVFLITVLGLLVLFYFLPHIVLYIEGIS